MRYITSESTNHCISLLYFFWLQHFHKVSSKAFQLQNHCDSVCECICLVVNVFWINRSPPFCRRRIRRQWMDAWMSAWMGGWKSMRKGKKDERGPPLSKILYLIPQFSRELIGYTILSACSNANLGALVHSQRQIGSLW